LLLGMKSRAVPQLQLGAGVFLTDFRPDEASSAMELRAMIARALEEEKGILGLTTGTGMFRCIPALRSPGEDAGRSPTADSLLLDGWTATLSGTLLETGAEAFAAVLPFSQRIQTEHLTSLSAPMQSRGCQGLRRLCWIGDTSGGLALIELTDAVNLPGASLTFAPGGEGTIPFEFRAHARPPVTDAPFRILFFS